MVCWWIQNLNHKEDQHIYYIEKNDKIIKRNKEWDIKVICECGVKIHNKKHKSEHLKTRKHLDFMEEWQNTKKHAHVEVAIILNLVITNILKQKLTLNL